MKPNKERHKKYLFIRMINVRSMKMLNWLFCFLMLSMIACSSENSIPATTVNISLSSDSLIFDYLDGSKSVTVTANDEWGISSNQSWCTFTPSGSIAGAMTLNVNVTKNETLSQRNAILTLKRNSYTKALKVIQSASPSISFDASNLIFGYKTSNKNLGITASGNWTASSDQSWCHLSASTGVTGNTTMNITVDENSGALSRTATLTFMIGTFSQTFTVQQGCNEGTTDVNITVPDGYILMWHDEFNNSKPAMPATSDWWYETGASGWGNNELENYVAGKIGSDTLAYVSDGSLKIYGRKINNTVYSIRMNTNTSWTYGYFEARLKLPKGKGNWPAFWMLPKNFTSWPADGEIDIMEEIGADPNLVSATIHCTAYNSTINTQKTSRKYVDNAEGEFHIYAMEWTANYIKGFIDGVNYFTFNNDGTGNKNTWPYNAPFYLKLNLAWGGNWGGYKGVDESALPLTYEIDYVRVFQK